MDATWMGPCGWAAAASEDEGDLRKGPWTVEEDVLLAGYIEAHGEGRWNELARAAGLRRTGKSCRLRWLNYLRPDVRRGDFTPQEQLLILELHFRWGNRWSKIAQQLPGRTDNEIKNYWRTRVQKHAKQLKCDVNSKQFQDIMRHLWMPRLVERIQATAAAATTAAASATTAAASASSQHAASMSVVPNKSLVGRSDMCGSPDTTTTTSSTAESWSTSVSFGAQFPSNEVVVASEKCGSASARCSDDMFDGSWSDLLARACDDSADSFVLPNIELGECGDNWWSLEDIWLQQQY